VPRLAWNGISPLRRRGRLVTWVAFDNGATRTTTEKVMGAEIQAIVDEIKQSVGLLRRHL
jgi:hypothetical protein